MSEILDCYRALQVHPLAEPEVIAAAYRALARKYHPDVEGGSEERMVILNRAWAILGNPRLRASYDRDRAAHQTKPSVATEPSRASPSATNEGPPLGRPSGSLLEFGRYAGWSLGQIAHHDPVYLQWLAATPGGRRYQVEIEAILHPGRQTKLGTH